MRGRALKDLTSEHDVAGTVARMEVTLTLNGDHFDAWFLPTRLFFPLALVPAVVVFKD